MLEQIKFKVIDWHQSFDCLIGTDALEELLAVIDYKTNILTIGNKEIYLFFEYKRDELKETSQIVIDKIRIPVTIDRGDVIIPQQTFGEINIPECISKANDGYCTIPIDNRTECKITFLRRVPVMSGSIFNIEQKCPQKSPKINIEKQFRIAHLNNEEKDKIVKNYAKKITSFTVRIAI